MAPTKLSDSDRQDILVRYRQPRETTSTLARHFGVSSTTISRILKRGLSSEEYEELVQQKRALSGAGKEPQQNQQSQQSKADAQPDYSSDSAGSPEQDDPEPEPELGQPKRRIRKAKRSRAAKVDQPILDQPTLFELPSDDATDELPPSPAQQKKSTPGSEEEQKESEYGDEAELSSILDEDEDEDEEFADEDESLDDLDEGLDDEFDAQADEEGAEDLALQFREVLVQVLPLSEARLPKTCYLVIDRGAELVTRPLRDFGELGQLPADEVQAKTLPVFENHRVARRFSRRTQRVVKVPNGEIFYKTSPYLQAKGITRLLIDGQVYSL